MKQLCTIILLALLLQLSGCSTSDEFTDDPEGNFDFLWTLMDEHYTLFGYKDVDWDAIGRQYRAKVTPNMSQTELFDVCSTMLKELKDGHTNLISSFDVSRYWIWEQYPENYDERLIDEHYLNFDYKRVSGIKYQILPSNIGYMRYASFESGIGEGNLSNVLSYLASSDGLIIDVRSNGGGYLTNVETLVRRFLSQRTMVGSISHKTGKGHDDFSKPYAYYYTPSDHVRYLKPVVVLCNRGTFSAANNFVSVMKQLPQVTVVGDTTGGGCGLPFNGELPNGWSIRFSSALLWDAQGQLTEFGVAPDVKVDLLEPDEQQGRDTMLDAAIAILSGQH